MITKQNVTEIAPNQFAGEASSLGFRAGTEPGERLGTNMGNGLDFVKFYIKSYRGELVSWMYRQSGGSLTLEVFND
jgi:hypothetical protein